VAEEPSALAREAAERFDVLVFGPSPAAGKEIAEAVEPLATYGRVLLFVDLPAGQYVADALRAGVHGLVTRLADDQELLHAVAAVARGGLYLSAEQASRALSELREPTAAASPTLAPRETETLRWLAAGFTHGQIARRMDLTEATVSTYVKRIKNKLNLGNKADLTRKAIELGLLETGMDPATALRRA
jgi:DNA-binding NarL/FixJ family response regulator